MIEPGVQQSRPIRPPNGEIAVAAAPSVSEPDSPPPLIRALPIVMALGMLAVTVGSYRAGVSVGRSPMYALLPLTMLASTVAAALSGRNRLRNSAIDDQRDTYLAYLADLRHTVSATAASQRAFLHWLHPHPGALWTLAGGPRMWERRASDPDYGVIRVGIGSAPLATELVAPEDDPARRGDSVTDTALRRFLDTHGVVGQVPVAVPLVGTAPLRLDGDAERARGLLRAVLCELATLHHPADLQITAAPSPHWEWLKWLPHCQDGVAGVGANRLLVVDDPMSGLWIGQPDAGQCARRLQVSESTLSGAVTARPDYLSLTDAQVCARRLAAQRWRCATADASWSQLLGIDDVDRFDPDAAWAGHNEPRLRVPIGTDATGNPVLLDITEAAQGGSGPHGLCIGATGSGKSELLRTLVLSMMVRHSPHDLNLVLVDFKGGATFLGFDKARHVSAIITNLAAEAPLVARMGEVLRGEMQRRQELLRAAEAANVTEYSAARQPGQPRLPALLIIVDEFSELLDQQPDFVDTFVAIGRLGRSLGIYLLLASQRLEEGRLRGLDAHLSYRICLKTMSAAESRMVLGVTHAYELPNSPGAGFLRTADGVVRAFQTAFVSGGRPLPAGAQVRLFTALADDGTSGTTARADQSVLQAMLARLAGHGPAARQMWLPPLGRSPSLGALLGGDHPHLCVPIGVVDRPFEQRRTPLMVRLDGAGGHVAVVGAPRTGKSTTLVTLLAALCAAHDATQVAFYCVDLGGGVLAKLGWLPQVGSVAGRDNPELIRRMVAELEAIVTRRETATATGEHATDIFLVIDGFAALCREFDRAFDREFDMEATIIDLAARGLSYGVHVVVSASRWVEIRPALRDLIATRIELRLGDPAESELDRRKAQQVPRDQPGRGLTDSGLHMLVARPHGWQPARHPEASAPQIRLLPSVVDRSELAAAGGDQPLLGVAERALEPVVVDFGRQPHLLVLGDTECGKTSVLRIVGREVARTATPEQAQLLVIDYRRSLMGAFDALARHHLAGYAASAAAAEALLAGLVKRLAARMPGAQVSVEQLRARSWWSGPQWYLLVDDYDVVASTASNPLTALLDYLPHAADIGLHLVIARRSGAAARAMYEPVAAALYDLGAMSLAMSGAAADAAPVLSGRGVALPPGRGALSTRRDGARLIQVAWEP